MQGNLGRIICHPSTYLLSINSRYSGLKIRSLQKSRLHRRLSTRHLPRRPSGPLIAVTLGPASESLLHSPPLPQRQCSQSRHACPRSIPHTHSSSWVPPAFNTILQQGYQPLTSQASQAAALPSPTHICSLSEYLSNPNLKDTSSPLPQPWS
jgi:hypothetical protein